MRGYNCRQARLPLRFISSGNILLRQGARQAAQAACEQQRRLTRSATFRGRVWDSVSGALSGRRLARTRTRAEPSAPSGFRQYQAGLTNSIGTATAHPAAGCTASLGPAPKDALLAGVPNARAQAGCAPTWLQPPHTLAHPAVLTQVGPATTSPSASAQLGERPAAAQRELSQ